MILVNGWNIFCGRWENALLDWSILRFLRKCKNQTARSSQKKLQNTTINLPSYIFRVHTLTLLAPFFIYFVVELLPIVWIERVNIVSMFRFLETDIREQKKYEKRIQTSVDNTVNDLRYEIKFENCVRDKNNFFIKHNIAFLSWTKI